MSSFRKDFPKKECLKEGKCFQGSTWPFQVSTLPFQGSIWPYIALYIVMFTKKYAGSYQLFPTLTDFLSTVLRC